MTLLQVDAVQIMSIIECNTQMGQGDDNSNYGCIVHWVMVIRRLFGVIDTDNVLDNMVVALPGVGASLHCSHY